MVTNKLNICILIGDIEDYNGIRCVTCPWHKNKIAFTMEIICIQILTRLQRKPNLVGNNSNRELTKLWLTKKECL